MEKKLTKSGRVSPEEELNRCVWMTAGVISFKLCPFNYDCEHCDFDRVMRLQAKPVGMKSKVKRFRSGVAIGPEISPTTSPEKEGEFFTFSVGEVDERLHIHPTHMWARHEYDHTWKVGVDTLLAYILPSPVKAELYRPNQEIIQQEVFGRILTEAGTVFVTAPISGRLVQANPRLAHEPDLVQKDPWGEGWLAIIDWFEDGAELERLYSGTKAVHFLEEEAQHLKVLLKYRGISVNPVGPTVPDGGAEIKYLHQILAPKVCLNLARELIVSGKEIW
jgi:glycine cleavage system H lipoate-binding protein